MLLRAHTAEKKTIREIAVAARIYFYFARTNRSSHGITWSIWLCASMQMRGATASGESYRISGTNLVHAVEGCW